MSYGLVPYTCNLDYINELGRNLKEDELAGLRESLAPALAQIDSDFMEPVKAIQALDDFIAGKVNHPSYPHLYWYVFEILCHVFGGRLPNESCYPCDPAIVDNLSSIKLYCLSHPVLPMPDDFPSVYACRPSSQAQLREELKTAPMPEECRKEMNGWLDFVQPHEQDLVVFYY
ncbi:DUF7691 family protein [Marinobacter xestospongiae]|uniref:DUF7691 domain-containing protein n=1 Tax=Marinobacter xestospongiae TaxID=994319 RepID=A0ABU3VW20_9GAMM|nr:hypothetical protein [Marinobacter xestospongiae]MCK7566636.1 hypothetical protein [Marinobacter xestospongiae]MDV2078459.1 hypothetical protein [Marinobacter xestospongiae]